MENKNSDNNVVVQVVDDKHKNNSNNDNNNNDDNNDSNESAEDRLNYLRERGVEISTHEERAATKIANATSVAPIFEQLAKLCVNDDNDDDGSDDGSIKFVLIPHDDSKPMKTIKLPSTFTNDHGTRSGDLITTFVKPYFADRRSVDANILQQTATKHFSSGGTIQGVDGSDGGSGGIDMSKISPSAMNAVAAEGSVETFPLVHPAETNKYTGVYIYLDEVGMLKKLPSNKRASQIGGACGYNPPPIFYGDIFVGRTQTQPKMINVDFEAGIDTAGNAEWMKRAVSENLAWQQGMNAATGRKDQVQPAHAGTDGAVAEELNFTWTQDEEEIELSVPTIITTTEVAGSTIVNKKEIKVIYKPKVVTVSYQGEEIVRVSLYDSVDVDGCTWTLNTEKTVTRLIITCEKQDPGKIWPRIG